LGLRGLQSGRAGAPTVYLTAPGGARRSSRPPPGARRAVDPGRGGRLPRRSVSRARGSRGSP